MQSVTEAAADAHMTLLVAILHVHAHNSTCCPTILSEIAWLAQIWRSIFGSYVEAMDSPTMDTKANMDMTAVMARSSACSSFLLRRNEQAVESECTK